MIGYKFVIDQRTGKRTIVTLLILGCVDPDPIWKDPIRNPMKTDACIPLSIMEYTRFGSLKPSELHIVKSGPVHVAVYEIGKLIEIPNYTSNGKEGIYFFEKLKYCVDMLATRPYKT